MVLWRISNHTSLDGEGGLLWPGRWHSKGRRIVYCAQSPPGALLEALIHFEFETSDLPLRYRLLNIAVPDSVTIDHVRSTDLPDGWARTPEITRAIGDDWLEHARSALLTVPSALAPETSNVLINPGHAAAAGMSVAAVTDHVLDRRLLR